MKQSKPTKSNSQHKVLRMIARNEQLERFDGKFVAMNRKYKDRSKYDRKEAKRELRRDLRGSYCLYTWMASWFMTPSVLWIFEKEEIMKKKTQNSLCYE